MHEYWISKVTQVKALIDDSGDRVQKTRRGWGLIWGRISISGKLSTSKATSRHSNPGSCRKYFIMLSIHFTSCSLSWEFTCLSTIGSFITLLSKIRKEKDWFLDFLSMILRPYLTPGIFTMIWLRKWTESFPPEVVKIRAFFPLTSISSIMLTKVVNDMIIKCLASKYWAWNRFWYLKINQKFEWIQTLKLKSLLKREIAKVDLRRWDDSKYNDFWSGAHQTYVCLSQDKFWMDVTDMAIQIII